MVAKQKLVPTLEGCCPGSADDSLFQAGPQPGVWLAGSPGLSHGWEWDGEDHLALCPPSLCGLVEAFPRESRSVAPSRLDLLG